MARGTRLDAPGSVHHVTARGIDRRAIFFDDEDRRAYLGYLNVSLRGSDTPVLAWALMANHVHLLLRTGTRPLSRSMQMLGTNYARYFNQRRGRQGYVFQGRYGSFLIEKDAYLLAAIRYVHLNPIKAGLVASIEQLVDWPWTGHPALMGRADQPFQAVRPILSLFHDDATEARRRLHEWMGACATDEYETLHAPVGPGGGREAPVIVDGAPIHRNARAAGSAEFAQETLVEVSKSRAHVAARRRRWTLARIVAHVCLALGVEPDPVRQGRRTAEASRARAAAAYLAHRDLALPLVAMTDELGVSVSSLSRAIQRGRKVVATERLTLD